MSLGPEKPSGPDDVAARLAEARNGSTQALGHLLELSRRYLLGVANAELESGLRAKGGASDVVQDAFLEAQRIFHRFQGGTREELLAWLRAILLNKLDDFSRRYLRTEKRQAGREIGTAPDSEVMGAEPVDGAPSPSMLATQSEELQRTLQALDRLPETYRQVIIWRQWDDLSFEEIALRLGKNVDAARMIWWRAIERLEHELGSWS